MTESGSGAGAMALAGDIFTDMVVEQAIKDKTEQVEAEMNAADTNDNDEVELEEQKDAADELDELEAEFDELMDDESEKIMRNYREMKLAEAKFDYEEQQKNMTLGHGTY